MTILGGRRKTTWTMPRRDGTTWKSTCGGRASASFSRSRGFANSRVIVSSNEIASGARVQAFISCFALPPRKYESRKRGSLAGTLRDRLRIRPAGLGRRSVGWSRAVVPVIPALGTIAAPRRARYDDVRAPVSARRTSYCWSPRNRRTSDLTATRAAAQRHYQRGVDRRRAAFALQLSRAASSRACGAISSNTRPRMPHEQRVDPIQSRAGSKDIPESG